MLFFHKNIEDIVILVFNSTYTKYLQEATVWLLFNSESALFHNQYVVVCPDFPKWYKVESWWVVSTTIALGVGVGDQNVGARRAVPLQKI
jgi:hypothetical protein